MALSMGRYCNLGYGWHAAEPHCVQKGVGANCTTPHVTQLSHLPYDFPVAALFNSAALPAEPFSRNISIVGLST
jgi:hypothetical protein